VNKTEMIEHIAQQADLSKASAGRALEAFIQGVQSALRKGDAVTLVGFGTFAVSTRPARTGRNPRTGEAIPIKARNVVTFHASAKLKGMVQGDIPAGEDLE